MATMKASHERIDAMRDVSLEMTEACLEKTEVNQEKVETKMEACLEEEEVETIGALENQYDDWHLDIWCCRQPKKLTQGDVGSGQKLAAAQRLLTAVPFLLRARDKVIRDQARMMSYAESLKDEHLRREVRGDLNATMA
jgi:hypothetical protein